MAYQVHKVEGFVLGGVDTGEGDRYLSLYTKELGLVRAVARSVRQERSRLRYDLEDFSYGEFRLVRGREVWRVTGASAEWNVYRECTRPAQDLSKQVLGGAGAYEKVSIVTNVFALVRRLVVGEGDNAELFTTLVAGTDFLREFLDASTDDLRNFEHVFVFRILHALGYVKHAPPLGALLDTVTFEPEHLSGISPLRPALASAINRALHESQL